MGAYAQVSSTALVYTAGQQILCLKEMKAHALFMVAILIFTSSCHMQFVLT